MLKYMSNIENCDDITKFFYVMYDTLLTTKNENNFTSNLVELLRTFGFGNFKNILNVKILTLNLKYEYKFSYKLCLLSYIKCDLFHKLVEIYDFDLKSNETKILEQSIKKLSTVCDDILYIDAFDLYSYRAREDNEIESKIDTKKTWEFETRNVIIQSLILLVEHFSLDNLKLMGVKLITYDETLEMSFKELSKYYNKQIVKIDRALKLRKQYCDSFIEVEKSFVMALISFDDEIIFDDFEVIVKSSNKEIKEIDDEYEIVGEKIDELTKIMEEFELMNNVLPDETL